MTQPLQEAGWCTIPEPDSVALGLHVEDDSTAVADTPDNDVGLPLFLGFDDPVVVNPVILAKSPAPARCLPAADTVDFVFELEL